MTVYPPYMQRQKQVKNETLLDKVSIVISILMLLMMIALVCHSCVEAIVKTAENEDEYKRPVYVEQSYQRPAAYRLATPTMKEMDHMEVLLKIQEVLL